MKADNLAIDYDKILSGPEYFYCEHYHCTMTRAACLANQNSAKKIANAPSKLLFRFGIDVVDRSMSCLNCKQGKQTKKIKKAMEAAAPKRKRGRIRVNIGKCKKRGCNEPAKTRGLCRKHYQQLWRAEGKKKTKKKKKGR